MQGRDFFKGQGMMIDGLIHLSGREAFQAVQNGAILVDLRFKIETDYKKFDLPEVLYIPFEELDSRLSQIPKDRPVIMADSVGLRSKEAVKLLLRRGYGNVANLNGGILDWEHDGLPVKVDPDKQLSGSCTCRLRPKT
jgi:rhodanese-related sulfurtransferase